MTIYGAFVGVDQYADANVSDLTGARRDALALWALFSDSIAGIKAQVVADSQATLANVRAVLDDTLGAATTDDTVILSFSCHGTHDHRIAFHDADIKRLPDTTLPMQELADRFRASKAKVVICILDCCFSGGAPAKVIEQSPAARDAVNIFEQVGGVGRILIAASNINEVALEMPGKGHGLLTGAFLEAFQEGSGTVSVTAAMDLIMQRVRATAAQIGYVQTPVLVGHVESGLALPVLTKGRNYFAAFPELKTTKLAGPISELSAFHLPPALLQAWEQRFSTELNSLQLTAINDHGILEGNSLFVVAPTSSGKTFIGELGAAKAVAEKKKAVFLFPYKALVNEKFDQFTNLYQDILGYRVIRCTGDYQDEVGKFFRGKYDMALFTYETFLSLSLSNPAVLNQIGLVVLDEAQFITDPTRGITVELLLTYLLAAKQRGIAPQLVTLSAVIGGVNHFDAWLGCSKLVTDHRPVPLVEGVIDRNGIYQFRDGTTEGEVRLVPAHQIVQRKLKPSAQDLIVPLVQTLIKEGKERVIVFRNKRGSAEGCANYLAEDLGLPPAREVADLLPSHDLSSSSTALHKCLEGGTAFHTSNLSREERVVVENGFRQRDGKVVVLAATTTVAAGINTPASTVILAEQEFMGEDGRPFTVAEYKNMAGRAGRVGYNERGRSIIYADNAMQRRELFARYVKGVPEALKSSFDPNATETWVLKLLAQVPGILRTDLIHSLANTYGGYLANIAHPGWKADMERKLVGILDEMIRLELAEEERGYVKLTLLGRACGRSPLSFPSSLRLVSLLKSHSAGLTAEGFLVLTQVLEEADAIYCPLMKRGQLESKWPNEISRRYGPALGRLLQRHAADTWAYYARSKKAAVLWSWIRGVPMDQIEREYTSNAFTGAIAAGHVRGFADAARFYLSSAYQIATIVLMDKAPSETEMQNLIRQLELGISEEALPLLEVPVNLQRGEYLALVSAGVRSMENLWALSDTEFARFVSTASARALSKARPKEQVVTAKAASRQTA